VVDSVSALEFLDDVVMLFEQLDVSKRRCFCCNFNLFRIFTFVSRFAVLRACNSLDDSVSLSDVAWAALTLAGLRAVANLFVFFLVRDSLDDSLCCQTSPGQR
jgi:hypothetical protein